MIISLSNLPDKKVTAYLAPLGLKSRLVNSTEPPMSSSMIAVSGELVLEYALQESDSRQVTTYIRPSGAAPGECSSGGCGGVSRLTSWKFTSADMLEFSPPAPDFYSYDRIIVRFQDGSWSETVFNAGDGGEAKGSPKKIAGADAGSFYAYGYTAPVIPGVDLPFTAAWRTRETGIAYTKAVIEHPLFTTGTVLGAGLYENGIWTAGGSGFPLAANWVGDSRLRWLVRWRGGNYVLRSSDWFSYPIGCRGVILRKGLSYETLPAPGAFTIGSILEYADEAKQQPVLTLNSAEDILIPFALYEDV